MVKHHVVKEDETMLQLLDKLFEGVREESRIVRLAAGRGLTVIMQTYAHISPVKCDPIISRLWDMVDGESGESDIVTETLMMAIGSMLSISESKVLARLAHLLIMQLGRNNPVLSASASLSLSRAVNNHNKGLYILVQPVLPDLALGLVQRINARHVTLEKFCGLAKVGIAEFLKMTLPYTVPTLFASCSVKILDAVAKEIGSATYKLFVERTHQVLASIFLLPESTDTTVAIHFIMKLMNDATNAEIDQITVIKSCFIQLLAELVVVMGDNKELVHRILHPSSYNTPDSNTANPTQTNRTVTALLSPHALGLISYINDMLQGSLGKKSLEMRRTIIRSLGCLLTYLGSSVTEVAPQMMATFQTLIIVPEFAEDTLRSWFSFLITLGPDEVGPYVAATTAAMVMNWSSFSPASRDQARKSLEYLVVDIGKELGQYLDDIVDLSAIHELYEVFSQLKDLRSPSLPESELKRILHRSSSYNLTVAFLSLQELKTFMLENRKEFMENLMHGDIFDPQLGLILATIIAAASRDGDGADSLRSIAYECLGILGAVDPDRCEMQYEDPTIVIIHNFADEGESMQFVIHLISDLLVGAFRATSDSVHQRHLAYAIQELLRFCQFTKSLLSTGQNGSISVKVRNRWNGLPGHVIETISPLLTGRFKLAAIPQLVTSPPIYPSQATYREWIQVWTGYLVESASGSTAQEIFNVFRGCIRGKDVTIAYKLLPHLVLNILISGADPDADAIREEMLAVLQDQVNKDSTSSLDKKLLSAQAIFMLLDHVNKWIRVVRRRVSTKKIESKRSRVSHTDPLEEQLARVDSILSSIDQSLMAKAAFQCRAFARSLMSYEQQILALKQRSPMPNLSEYYERLHEIYAQLDEPDGMEGISTLIFSPSLEHKIRQHESTGRWTAAQSCWELRLQQSPDNVDFHIGLLRCLRNLGHYDTLRTHVRGVLTRKPEWEQQLAEFHIESAWVVGAWDDVRHTLERNNIQTPSMALARVLLSMHEGNNVTIPETLSAARSLLGAPIAAAGVKGYRRGYDAALRLHLLHELEHIHANILLLPQDPQSMSTQRQHDILSDLSRTLSVRLEATQSNFKSREPILSMRRTVFAMLSTGRRSFATEIGRAWLSSHWQTSYSAVLQAQQSKARLSFIESAKLTYASEDPLRALHELENAMKLLGMLEDTQNVLDLTVDDESQKLRAKAHVLRARWMGESDRYEAMSIVNAFTTATQLQPNWENVHFYSGRFQDAAYKSLPEADKFPDNSGIRMHLQTVRSYVRSIRYGSKYIYQTVPRLLTIWLDLGEDKESARTDIFRKLNDMVSKAIKETPAYKCNPEVYKHLSGLIIKVIEEYPKQALWLFTSAVKSTKANREQRGREIFNQLRSNPRTSRTVVAQLVNQSLSMTNELLGLCDAYVENDRSTLSMSKDFSRLSRLGHCDLIIPLQDSLTATLPPTSDSQSTYQPFPINSPTFAGFEDVVTIMHSLAKPRKITIIGSDGKSYPFLGKPKDDLRKDARLMDFNTIINKLLKANSESRRRQLRIRTYGVVTLNEECGFIQWVPNTSPVRPVLVKYYDSRRVRNWSNEMQSTFAKIKQADDKQAAQIFQKDILSMFPPVFHEWFIETFPEPTAWLASRLTYARTTAVMSMVGFILGLGDRHCENILLDDTTGDLIHVDFNCLFEKGKNLETPERVPFRLTQNLVDGLGVTGVEGVFRIACELTLQLLRDNKDTLMSVLDAFVHDPLVEWEDEKRKLERVRDSKQRNIIKPTVDMHMLAKNALNPIEKKFRGIYAKGKEKLEKEMSTSNLVEALIQEATDMSNLAKMYPGWAPWH
ncbi:hypothetical protein BDQ17DRAFT_1389499 [Cyathus striatus]|nr:hypothetical protein BDQ17DRAFT_1389499 [Cyathus striatus]